MADFSSLKKLKRLVNQEKPWFGQLQSVDEINYLDAHVAHPSGKALSTRQKERKKNQFCFIGLSHERHMIGLAIVDLSLVSNGFVYVYDKLNNTLEESNKLSPLGLNTSLSSQPNDGELCFKSGSFIIELSFSPDGIRVVLESKRLSMNATIKPSLEPMCLCTRTGYSGWVYMQKQTSLTCVGEATFNEERIALTASNCLASIDWTLGYMTRETFWNWSSINATLDSGDKLGLNLVCGVNDTSFTENAVWLNDRMVNMPLTVFEYDHHDVMKPWHIYSNPQMTNTAQVDLHFTPRQTREDNTNALLIASHFSQLIGTYSGTITLPDQTITLDKVWGLAEDHYAKW